MDEAGSRYNLLVVLGPTASGKTQMAVRLARRLGGEILSADSRQVYRGMDLGTGKDLAEYSLGGTPVPYHLIDICEPREEFSVFSFQQCFRQTFDEVLARGHLPVLVGGSGLYLDAVLRNYDLPEVPPDPRLRERLAGAETEDLIRQLQLLSPQLHNRTDLTDRERLVRAIEIACFKRKHQHREIPRQPIRPLVLGIRLPRTELHRRIEARLEERLKAGMVEEVSRLHREGLDWRRLDAFGLEYRYIGLFLRGELTRGEMVQTLTVRIRQMAKRQETWFRGMEKKGAAILWITPQEDTERILALVRE